MTYIIEFNITTTHMLVFYYKWTHDIILFADCMVDIVPLMYSKLSPSEDNDNPIPFIDFFCCIDILSLSNFFIPFLILVYSKLASANGIYFIHKINYIWHLKPKEHWKFWLALGDNKFLPMYGDLHKEHHRGLNYFKFSTRLKMLSK